MDFETGRKSQVGHYVNVHPYPIPELSYKESPGTSILLHVTTVFQTDKDPSVYDLCRKYCGVPFI